MTTWIRSGRARLQALRRLGQARGIPLRWLGIGASRHVEPVWVDHVIRDVPFFHTLAESERDEFLADVAEFVRTRRWLAAAGHTLDDRQRIVIAACAARLVRGLGLHYYERLHTIRVHATPIWVEGVGRLHGAAHPNGVVDLSWSSVLEGLHDPGDGFEPAGHEFAHMLDLLDGAFDGRPPNIRHHFDAWAGALHADFSENYHEWRRLLAHEPPHDIAEFFAYLTELFFERPSEFAAISPDLFAAFQRFFRQDPLA